MCLTLLVGSWKELIQASWVPQDYSFPTTRVECLLAVPHSREYTTVEPEKQSKEVISEENRKRQEQHRENLDKYPSKFPQRFHFVDIRNPTIFVPL